MPTESLAVQAEWRIFLLRGQKVMLDFDLAELYGVETRALKQAVRRNRERFPADFAFEFHDEEVEQMVSQNVNLAAASLVERCRWSSPSKAWPCSPACCAALKLCR